MVLQVEFDDFGPAVQRVFGGKVDAYLCQNADHTVATAGRSSDETIVVATTEMPEAEARTALVAQGMNVFLGRWTDDLILADLESGSRTMYIAGVGFKAVSGVPGIWLDAFPVLPTQVQVLKAMYEELTQSGEMAEVAFEEFVRLAEANVVVASPSDLKSYLAGKSNSSDS